MSKDIAKEFGKRLRKCRLEKGWSQEELGFEIDSPKNTISNYENATRCPNLRTAQKLADALGVELSDMLK